MSRTKYFLEENEALFNLAQDILKKSELLANVNTILAHTLIIIWIKMRCMRERLLYIRETINRAKTR